MPRPWIRLDVGLLDDERFEDLNPDQLAAWVKSYLIIAREGDSIRDLGKLARLLTKEGIAHSAQRVDELDRMDWFVPATRRDGITLRGYEAKQPLYRGPSDLPEAKAARNSQRRRGASKERAGASRSDTVRDSTVRAKKGAKRSDEERRGASKPVPLKEALESTGLAKGPFFEEHRERTS